MEELNKLFEIAKELKNYIGTEDFILSILKQMSIDELEETLRFIDRIYDTNLFE